MGEAGSHGATPGPNPQPSHDPENAPGFNALPVEVLSLIIEALPRRCWPSVRLSCRKLETATEPLIKRLHLHLEAEPTTAGSHYLLKVPNRPAIAAADPSSKARSAGASAQLPSSSSASASIERAAPGWAPFVADLSLTLHPHMQHDNGAQRAGVVHDPHVHQDDLQFLAVGPPALPAAQAPAAGEGAAPGPGPAAGPALAILQPHPFDAAALAGPDIMLQPLPPIIEQLPLQALLQAVQQLQHAHPQHGQQQQQHHPQHLLQFDAGAAPQAGAAAPAGAAAADPHGAAAAAFGPAGRRALRLPLLRAAAAEALLCRQLQTLTLRLLPSLRRLTRLSLQDVPRRCMPAAGGLAAAATALTELRLVRSEPEPAPPAAPQAAAAAVPPQVQPADALEFIQALLAWDGAQDMLGWFGPHAGAQAAPQGPPQHQLMHDIGDPLFAGGGGGGGGAGGNGWHVDADDASEADAGEAEALAEVGEVEADLGAAWEEDAQLGPLPLPPHPGTAAPEADAAAVSAGRSGDGGFNMPQPFPDDAAGPGPSSSTMAAAAPLGTAKGMARTASMDASPPSRSDVSTAYDDDGDAAMRGADGSGGGSGSGSGNNYGAEPSGGRGGAAAVPPPPLPYVIPAEAPAGPEEHNGGAGGAAAVGAIGVGGVAAVAAAAAAADMNDNDDGDRDDGAPDLIPPSDEGDGADAAASDGGDGDGGGDGGAGGAGGEAAFWGAVRGLPSLRRLELRGGRLRRADMEGLAALTGLRELHVDNVVNTHPGLAGLAALTGLTRLVIEELQYAGGAIHDEFCGLSRLTGLRSLSFLVVGPLPAEVLAWSELTGLTQLEITNHFDESLLPCVGVVLPRLTGLRSLNLSNFDITNSLLAALRPCKLLSRLVFGRFCVTAPCAVRMPEVRELQLGFVDDQQATEVPLVCVFPHLDSLHLDSRFQLLLTSAERIPRQLLGPAPPHPAPPQLPQQPQPAAPGHPQPQPHAAVYPQQQQQQQQPQAAATGAAAGGGAAAPAGAAAAPGVTLPLTRLHLYDALLHADLPACLPGLTCLRLDWSQRGPPRLLPVLGAWGGALRSLAWRHADGLRDAHLPELAAALPRLTELSLVDCTGLTDAGLTGLSGLTALTSLSVAGAAQLSASGLCGLLPRLPSLERLTLGDMAAVRPADCDALEEAAAWPRRLRVELLPRAP